MNQIGVVINITLRKVSYNERWSAWHHVCQVLWWEIYTSYEWYIMPTHSHCVQIKQKLKINDLRPCLLFSGFSVGSCIRGE